MKKIISQIRPEVRSKLHPELIKRLNRIDSEDFSIVRKKVAKEFARRGTTVTDSYIDELIIALKQYYAVALLDPANAHAVSVQVDDAWHMHLLDTDGYTKFCNEVVGEIMPHVHLDHDNHAQVENVRTLYDYTLEVLNEVFSHVNESFWPSPETQPKLDPGEILICYHKGNQDVYQSVQKYRLFEPTARGVASAFA